MRGQVAIVGIGVTQQGRKLGVTGLDLRRQALELALADAGVERAAIDGYIHASSEREDLRYLGIAPNFSLAVQTGGATASCSFSVAAGAILTGQAELVACGYGAAPSTPLASGGIGTFGAYGYGYPMEVGMGGAARAHPR